MSNRRIRSVLFCDDIRTEANGKEFAIGIYSGGMVVPQTPFQMSMLMARIEIDFGGVETKEFYFKIEDPLGNELMEQKIDLPAFDWNRVGSVVVGLQAIIFPVPGTYVLSGKFDDSWIEISDFRVDKVSPKDMQARMQEQIRRMADALH
jgi:hypothetical protein